MIYDVDGNRIARVDPGGAATVFIAGHELLITPASGTTATRYYEHAGDTVASRTDSTGKKGDIVWLGADQQDSVSWAVNSVTRVATIKYADPYGKSGTPRLRRCSGRRVRRASSAGLLTPPG